MSAMDDVAAKVGIDALDFFLKNLDFVQAANLREVYREELEIAADMIGYKRRRILAAIQRPVRSNGALGISLHTWGGQGHA